MAYRIEHGEGLDTAASRIALELVDESLQLLEGSHEATGLEEDVHQVRKNCKKLRGLARLVRPALGKGYARANTAFRDASRELSPIRDAHALLETFDSLAEATGGLQAPLDEVRAELEARSRAASAEIADGSARLDAARAHLQAGKRVIAQWPQTKDETTLEKGAYKTYARGREAMAQALAEPSDEQLHEWRKRAKYTWYHLRLLESAAPSVLSPLSDRFHDLSDALGDDHDLAVLRALLQDAPTPFGGQRAVRAALERTDRARAALQRRAFGLGARLYAEQPSAFAERLVGYWRAWQTHGPEPEAGELSEQTLAAAEEAGSDKTGH